MEEAVENNPSHLGAKGRAEFFCILPDPGFAYVDLTIQDASLIVIESNNISVEIVPEKLIVYLEHLLITCNYNVSDPDLHSGITHNSPYSPFDYPAVTQSEFSNIIMETDSQGFSI